MRARSAFLATAALTLASPAATLAATHPLEVTALAPAPGTIAPNGSYGYGSQAFEVTIPSRPASYSLNVEIASANVAGQDGTLANDYAVGGTFGSFTPRDSNPSVYTGTVNSSAWAKPGTYYLQFSVNAYGASCPDPGETSCVLMSPVYTYTVTAPSPAPVAQVPPFTAPSPTTPAPVAPPGDDGADETPDIAMTAAQARTYVRGVIRREAKRSARNLKYRCSRMNTDNFICASSWWDARYVWAVTIDLVDQGSDISYTGKGLRASLTCLKRHSVEHCARKVRW